MINHFILW